MQSQFEGRFKASIEHETAQSYLVVELLKPKCELVYSYQIEMIAYNPVPFIVPFEMRRKDEEIRFYYNITSKTALKDFLKNGFILKQQFINIVSSLLSSIAESKSLFLNEESFVLDEEYICIEASSLSLSLIYLPVNVAYDGTQALKDFILWIASKLAHHETLDNSIQNIIGFIKGHEFTIAGLSRLLDEIKNRAATPEQGVGGVLADGTAVSINEDEISLAVDRLSAGANSQKSRSGLKDLIRRFGMKTVLAALLSQVAVVGIAAVAEVLMKRAGIEGDTRYISIGMLVLVADLFLYKYLISKNANTPSRERTAQPKNVKNNIASSEIKKEAPTASFSSNNGACDSVKPQQSVPIAVRYEPEIQETTLLFEVKKMSAFLVCEKDGDMEKLEISKDRFILGRNPHKSDMAVPGKAVGRAHAIILFKDNEYFISDKDSKNGTFVNGEKLAEGMEYKLSNNDSIMLANVEFKFIIE